MTCAMLIEVVKNGSELELKKAFRISYYINPVIPDRGSTFLRIKVCNMSESGDVTHYTHMKEASSL